MVAPCVALAHFFLVQSECLVACSQFLRNYVPFCHFMVPVSKGLEWLRVYLTQP